MSVTADTFDDLMPEGYGRARKPPSRGVMGSVAVAVGLMASVGVLYLHTAGGPDAVESDPPAAPVVAVTAESLPQRYEPLLDPAFVVGLAPLSFAQSAPRRPTFELAQDALPTVVTEQTEPVAAPPVIWDETIPQPPPRPPTLRGRPVENATRLADRAAPPPKDANTVATAAPAEPSFFEKVFGNAPSRPMLAYAAPEDDAFGFMHGPKAGPPPAHDPFTAVYDISAHVVYLPNGRRLEAHSGLGELLDDPRRVNERNRGATPPHVYDLELRAQLFHGVQALRLNPVGEGSIYGRTGLLAHTFMLGPKGDSNGCVSFRDYNAFLQAYQSGEVKRLLVVARL